MDLPYAMTIESAADAVVTFKTKRVYPYHHWGIGCLSDVKKFREKNNEITVTLKMEFFSRELTLVTF